MRVKRFSSAGDGMRRRRCFLVVLGGRHCVLAPLGHARVLAAQQMPACHEEIGQRAGHEQTGQRR